MSLARLGPTGRLIALCIAVPAALVLMFLFWVVSGPGPLDFARGKRVSLADYKEADPTGPAAELDQADLVVRGDYLATVGDCAACHTAPGGEPFAGGLAFRLPFGTLYSPNITADNETGIGKWTDEDFLRAMHKGISADGTRLYPAFPFTAYTHLTDKDVLAIKAYLFSVQPAKNTPPENSLAFPFNQRWLMSIWSFFFNPAERFRPDADRPPEWNRGAYLVEALGHCGECHTPRNLLQAVDNRSKFSGAVAAGWRAYNITSSRQGGIGSWSDAELAQYLATGHAEGRGTATGPMGEAVDLSLSYLFDSDIQAIVTYLRSIPAIDTPDFPAPPNKAEPISGPRSVEGLDGTGEKLFAGACASCHSWDGAGALTPYASLLGSHAVNDHTATNVAQVIVAGAHRDALGAQGVMPSFGAAYSNVEIAALANYVTGHFGGVRSTLTAADVAALREQVSK